MYFPHPSVWDDPYDRPPIHKQAPNIFAQCWCRKAVSDAMWRIYSPHSLGVRIGTTAQLLQDAMRVAQAKEGIKFRLQNIKYVHPGLLPDELAKLELARKARPSFATTIASLFLKRRAFDHEHETRLVIHQDPVAAGKARLGISIEIEAAKLIESIWIDPRAPKEYIDAFKYYLKSKIKFRGTVAQSSLYSATDPAGV